MRNWNLALPMFWVTVRNNRHCWLKQWLTGAYLLNHDPKTLGFFGSAPECSLCTITSFNLGMMWKWSMVSVLYMIPMLTGLYNQNIIPSSFRCFSCCYRSCKPCQWHYEAGSKYFALWSWLSKVFSPSLSISLSFSLFFVP